MPKPLPTILPCPWCGTRAGYDPQGSGTGPTIMRHQSCRHEVATYYVECQHCLASGTHGYILTERAAITGWNRVVGRFWASEGAVRFARGIPKDSALQNARDSR